MSIGLHTNMKLISALRYNKSLKIQGFFLMSPSFMRTLVLESQ